jgi:hypothetical protein
VFNERPGDETIVDATGRDAPPGFWQLRCGGFADELATKTTSFYDTRVAK